MKDSVKEMLVWKCRGGVGVGRQKKASSVYCYTIRGSS